MPPTRSLENLKKLLWPKPEAREKKRKEMSEKKRIIEKSLTMQKSFSITCLAITKSSDLTTDHSQAFR